MKPQLSNVLIPAVINDTKKHAKKFIKDYKTVVNPIFLW